MNAEPVDLIAAAPAPTPVFTVSEITRTIRACLEAEIGEVWVEGEISNYRRQASGHQYFTLKDDRAQLACVLFRNTPGPRVSLADGMCVQAFGQLTLYESRGQHQLVVQVVQKKGLGALQARFEALKAKLEAEGLFNPARKRPLPRFAMAIGVVTSPTGAALRDMLNVLTRRAPWVRVLINPVRVQGTGAAIEIARAVEEFNEWRSVDLIVLARGGGSIEDLWEFNEEALARAIAGSALPVVSAVGHEIDFTICDFVADLRAPTPSAAAELIVPESSELQRRLATIAALFGRRLMDRLAHERERLRGLSRGTLAREARQRLDAARQTIDAAQETLERAARSRLNEARIALVRLSASIALNRLQVNVAARREALGHLGSRLTSAWGAEKSFRRARLDRASAMLRLLGPQATLERGYSITSNDAGEIIHQAATVTPGARLSTKFADGEVRSVAE